MVKLLCDVPNSGIQLYRNQTNSKYSKTIVIYAIFYTCIRNKNSNKLIICTLNPTVRTFSIILFLILINLTFHWI